MNARHAPSPTPWFYTLLTTPSCIQSHLISWHLIESTVAFVVICRQSQSRLQVVRWIRPTANSGPSGTRTRRLFSSSFTSKRIEPKPTHVRHTALRRPPTRSTRTLHCRHHRHCSHLPCKKLSFLMYFEVVLSRVFGSVQRAGVVVWYRHG